MANQNDAKIKALLQSIEQKKEKIGVKPRPSWKTNGVIETFNINTITSLEVCVSIVTSLILKRDAYDKACEFLELTKKPSSDIDDALSDLKTRAEMIQWDAEKKKLTAMEKQLKDLRSEDAKTEDALDDITKDLGL